MSEVTADRATRKGTVHMETKTCEEATSSCSPKDTFSSGMLTEFVKMESRPIPQQLGVKINNPQNAVQAGHGLKLTPGSHGLTPKINSELTMSLGICTPAKRKTPNHHVWMGEESGNSLLSSQSCTTHHHMMWMAGEQQSE